MDLALLHGVRKLSAARSSKRKRLDALCSPAKLVKPGIQESDALWNSLSEAYCCVVELGILLHGHSAFVILKGVVLKSYELEVLWKCSHPLLAIAHAVMWTANGTQDFGINL